jgi:hypothetical protein
VTSRQISLKPVFKQREEREKVDKLALREKQGGGTT